MPVLAARVAFQSIGGFTTDYRVLGCEQEFVSRCQVQGLACTTALMEMGSVEAWDPDWIKEKCYDEAVSQFRTIRPQIAAAPLALRDMLLLSKGLQAKGAGKKAMTRRTVPPKPVSEKRTSTAFSQLFALIEAPIIEDRGGKRDTPQKAKKVAQDAPKPAVQPTAEARAESPYVKMMREQLHRVPGSDTLTGSLLGVIDTTLFGWIRDEAHPERTVKLECLRSGRPFMEIDAGLDIDSAIPLPKDLRGHAFRCTVPQSCSIAESCASRST